MKNIFSNKDFWKLFRCSWKESGIDPQDMVFSKIYPKKRWHILYSGCGDEGFSRKQLPQFYEFIGCPEAQ